MFCDDEKKIIDLLKHWDSNTNFIGNILCDFKGILPKPFNNPTVMDLCFPSTNHAQFYVNLEMAREYGIDQLWQMLRRKVVILLNLLRLLEEEKCIRKVFNNPGSERTSNPDPKTYVPLANFDDSLQKELYELRNATFIVLPKLDDLIDNNYKTEEEMKNEREEKRATSTLRISKVALILSFVSVGVSICTAVSNFTPVKVLLKLPFFWG